MHLPQLVGVGVPSAFIVLHYCATGDKADLVQALLGLSLAVLLTGVINDIVKVCVGRSGFFCDRWIANACVKIEVLVKFYRPRPDFYYRCFPEGEMTPDSVCSGEESIVEEGRKSFPSGHSGCKTEKKKRGGERGVVIPSTFCPQGHSVAADSSHSTSVENCRYSVHWGGVRRGDCVWFWPHSSQPAQQL